MKGGGTREGDDVLVHATEVIHLDLVVEGSGDHTIPSWFK
jgi:hypothetical protein